MQQMIIDLYDDLYANSENGKLDNLSDLAIRLSKIVAKDPPWTARYLNSLMLGHRGVKASQKLSEALYALAAMQDGQSPLKGLIKPLEAFSVNGIENGSIVLGQSKRCLNCGVLFVGVVHNQVYCTKECRKDFYRR